MTRADLLKQIKRMVTMLGDKPSTWRASPDPERVARSTPVVCQLTRGYLTPREVGVVFGFAIPDPPSADARSHALAEIGYDDGVWTMTGSDGLTFTLEEWVAGFDDGIDGSSEIGKPKLIARVMNAIETRLADFDGREIEP